MYGKQSFRCFHNCHGNQLDMVLAHQNEAMLLAITVGDLDQVKCLVGHGVVVKTHERTALSISVEEEQIEIANFLICNGADVNFVDALGVPPLVLAVRSGNLNMIRLLIEAGADVNGKASVQKRTLLKSAHTTPLHVAASEEDSDLLNTLLAANADVNTKNAKLEMPLHLAAHSGNKVNIARLIACGAVLNDLDRSGYTPLHHALSEGHVDCVRELCRLGSSVNFPTSQEHTPLMLAVVKGQLEALKILLQFGPSINRREGHLQRTVVHTVIETCRHRVKDNNIMSVDEELNILDCLVQAGADVNLEDKNEETPFYLCVQIGCESLLNYLIRCENLNINAGKRNPLIIACSVDANQTTIELLIQYCPLLVNPPSTSGFTSSGLMAKLATLNYLPCMELLLEAGYQCSNPEAQLCQQMHPINTSIVNFVREQLLQPSPLLRLCRVAVRNCLQTRLHRNVLKLPVPQKLQDQILLNDVDIR